MDKKTIGNICKWVSVALVLLSVFMLFSGWITIADKDARREIKDSIKSAQEQLDLSKDEIEEKQELLEEWGIDIDIKSFIKQAKKFINIVKDSKISPSELAFTGPDLLKMADTLKNEEMLGSMIGGEFDEMIEGLEEVKTATIALIVFFYITLAAGIIIIILHVKDTKLPGITLVILNLIWWIIMGVSVHGINVYAEDELNTSEKLLKLTGTPFWTFIFSLAAAILWIYKDKVADMIGVTVTQPATSAAIEVNTGRVCPECGNNLKEGALFCPKCGSKYVEPIVEEPIDEINESEEAVEEEKGIFCSKCGKELTPDADFCPNCGTPRSK